MEHWHLPVHVLGWHWVPYSVYQLHFMEQQHGRQGRGLL